MAGLVAFGRDLSRDAKAGLSRVAEMEQRQEMAEDRMASAERQQRVSGVIGGATMGWMAGAQAGSIGGPAGMALGAAIGFAATKLF